MSRVMLSLLVSAALFAASAQAGPIGSGVGPANTYTGHAWFTHPASPGSGLTGFVAAGPTLADCQASFTTSMNSYIGDGYTLVSVLGCRATPAFAGFAVADGSLSDLVSISQGQLGSVMSAEATLRRRYNIDAYEAELHRLYRQPADGGR